MIKRSASRVSSVSRQEATKLGHRPFLNAFQLTILHQLDIILIAKLPLDVEPVFQEYRTLLAAILCFEVLDAPLRSFAALLYGLRRSGLELRVGDKHTHVVRLAEKPVKHNCRQPLNKQSRHQKANNDDDEG